MTRAQWYIVKYGGTWRFARKRGHCSRCACPIQPAELYFDTMQVIDGTQQGAKRFATKKLCRSCGEAVLDNPQHVAAM